MEKYFVYVGYYEVYITTQRLNSPLFLLSWHKTAANAEKRALRDCPSATILYDENSLENLGYDHILEECEPVGDWAGIKFWQA